MRVLFAAVVLVLGIAGVSPASADKLRGHSDVARRAAPLVIYDYRPGVIARAYWLAPWRHRHYFPTTGEKPEIGRDEDLSVNSATPEPAETFQRSWSTSSAFMHEQPLASARPLDTAPLPRAEQLPTNSDQNAGAVKP